ncbi:MAG: glycosyltransferase family 2 protein [Elusimicrobia bacterium]|nr:glycosyltransferase family 2 protein [Elusimicrobiota bacterium]
MGLLRKALSVVIPAYNEEARVGPAVEAALAWAKGSGFELEVLVSDDGSPDGTRRAAESATAGRPGVRVLTGPHRGKGAAVRRGMLAASMPAILFMDADQSAPAAEVEALWPGLDAGADVVWGSRALPGSRILVPQPGSRSWVGRAAPAVVRLSGLTEVRDTQCGFKLFRAEAARAIFSKATIDGFAFDLEVLALARRLGYRVVEAPIAWSHVEPSHLSLKRDLAGIALEVLRLAWRLRR